MKVCSTCKEHKDETEFYSRGPSRGNTLRSECKSCFKKVMRPRSKKHYRHNKEQYLDRNRKIRRELAEFVRQYKEANPVCVDCKLSHPPWRLDFDHLPDHRKKAVVSRTSLFTLESLKVEIAKCELVCANCHRDRTHYRGAGGN